MANVPSFVATPKATPQSFLPGDVLGTKKTVATAGATGSKVVGLSASSTDTSARVAQIWLTRSATSYLLHSQNIAINAGSDGTVTPQNLLANWSLPVDNDGQKFFFLESGDTLQVSMATTVTAAKEIDVLAIFGNF